MVNHYDVLSILMQWMERRRRDIELLLQKELYMLRRIWIGRTGNMSLYVSELPGFYNGVLPPSSSLTQVVNYERRRLATRELNPEELFQLQLKKYAPGY